MNSQNEDQVTTVMDGHNGHPPSWDTIHHPKDPKDGHPLSYGRLPTIHRMINQHPNDGQPTYQGWSPNILKPYQGWLPSFQRMATHWSRTIQRMSSKLLSCLMVNMFVNGMWLCAKFFYSYLRKIVTHQGWSLGFQRMATQYSQNGHPPFKGPILGLGLGVNFTFAWENNNNNNNKNNNPNLNFLKGTVLVYADQGVGIRDKT